MNWFPFEDAHGHQQLDRPRANAPDFSSTESDVPLRDGRVERERLLRGFSGSASLIYTSTASRQNLPSGIRKMSRPTPPICHSPCAYFAAHGLYVPT